MIMTIGIDSVSIERFAQWLHFSNASLQKIFDPSEIAYCKSVSLKSAERFAVRFAAKEAFFKALCSANPTLHYRFYTIAPSVIINKNANGSPFIVRQHLEHLISDNHNVLVSLSHTQHTAQAIVMIQSLCCK